MREASDSTMRVVATVAGESLKSATRVEVSSIWALRWTGPKPLISVVTCHEPKERKERRH